MSKVSDELKGSIKLYISNLPSDELVFMHQIIMDELYSRYKNSEEEICE